MDPDTNQSTTLYLTPPDWDTLYRISKWRCFKADARDAKYHFWNFWSSMDFASTILTTIGYGGMVPHTTAGKALVIVYALPGMLLMMSYLNLFALCILIIIRKVAPPFFVKVSLCSFGTRSFDVNIKLVNDTFYFVLQSNILCFVIFHKMAFKISISRVSEHHDIGIMALFWIVSFHNIYLAEIQSSTIFANVSDPPFFKF